MKTESDCHNRLCVRGMYRRDFLKLAAAACTGLLATGCSASQEPTASPTITPAPVPTASPTITPAPVPTAIPTYSAEDFSRMAYCGIRCWAACPEHAYPNHCEGCKSEGGKLSRHCDFCAIRKCASEKQVLTCAHCYEYPSCEADTWTRFPILRDKIDQIRSDLQTQS
jgi:hypothetical protein